MRTLKVHILEKLKVTTPETPIMTNREFFDILKEYTDSVNTISIMTYKVFGNNLYDMPKYSKDTTRYIEEIMCIKRQNLIVLRLHNIYNKKEDKDFIEVNIEQEGNDPVDFIDDESLIRLVEYMKHN